jgi:hypothetical protein
MKRLRTRRARVRFGDHTLDLVGQLVLKGRDARKATRVLWGRGKVQRDAAGKVP